VGGVLLTREGIERYVRNDDVLLPASATELAGWTPDNTETYVFLLTGYVSNATTTLTLTIVYSDPAAPSASNPITVYVYNASSLPVGELSAVLVFRALGGTAVSITATAGTADNIKVSTAVLRV